MLFIVHKNLQERFDVHDIADGGYRHGSIFIQQPLEIITNNASAAAEIEMALLDARIVASCPLPR